MANERQPKVILMPTVSRMQDISRVPASGALVGFIAILMGVSASECVAAYGEESAVNSPSAHEEQHFVSYARVSPFPLDTFLLKVMTLINENSGYQTKARVEDVLGVHFVNSRFEKNARAFWVESGKDWYFGAGVSTTSAEFVAPLVPDASGATSTFSISWKGVSFPELQNGGCLTIERFRRILVKSIWLAPEKWGESVAALQKPDTGRIVITGRGGYQCSATTMVCPPLPSVPYANTVYLRSVHGGSLPELTVTSEGPESTSCIVSLSVKARPPH